MLKKKYAALVCERERESESRKDKRNDRASPSIFFSSYYYCFCFPLVHRRYTYMYNLFSKQSVGNLPFQFSILLAASSSVLKIINSSLKRTDSHPALFRKCRSLAPNPDRNSAHENCVEVGG